MRALWPEAARDAGIVKADRNDADKQVVFGSVQTLRNDARLARYLAKGPPDLVIVDEAHHSIANEWSRVLGGIDAASVPALRDAGASGLAAIRAWLREDGVRSVDEMLAAFTG